MQTRSTSSFRKRAYELWYKLVTPIKPPADEDQQRRARLLGTIVLAGIVMIGG